MTEIAQLGFQTRGLYFSHSTVSQVNYSLSDVRNCHDRYLAPVESRHATYFGWTPKNVRVTDLDELTPLLVSGHERNHYTQLMSTPCGLLLWRIFNSITGGLMYITNKVGASKAKYTCYLPLTEWYLTVGHAELEKDPPSLPDSLSEMLESHRTAYEQSLPTYIESIFYEIIILLRFLDAFQGRSSLSMSEFVALANEAFRRLALRSDLELTVEWTAHDLSAPHYLPQGGFTLNEIVEAGARFWEFDVLQGLEVDRGILDQWEAKSIFGVYKSVYDWLSHELVDSMLARLTIDIALTAPIDLCCSEAISGRVYVEDVLPSWRLPKIVASIKNAFWSNDRSEQEYEVRHGIASRARIPTPEQTIKAALNQPFSGPLAWGADAKLYNAPEELTFSEYFSYTEREIRRAFEIRSADSLALVRPETPDVFQPALEFYKDMSLFHGSPTTEYSFLLHLQTYKMLVVNLALMALISDGDVSGLLPLQHSFSNRMALYGEEISEFQELWDAKEILRDAFDSVIFKLFDWRSN